MKNQIVRLGKVDNRVGRVGGNRTRYVPVTDYGKPMETEGISIFDWGTVEFDGPSYYVPYLKDVFADWEDRVLEAKP